MTLYADLAQSVWHPDAAGTISTKTVVGRKYLYVKECRAHGTLYRVGNGCGSTG